MSKKIYLFLFFYLAVILIFNTNQILISDEYSYYVISKLILIKFGMIDTKLTPELFFQEQHYAIGFPLILSMVTWVSGWFSFLINPILVCLNVLILKKLFIHLKIDQRWAIGFFLMPPVLLFGKHLMSGVSAMTLTSVLLYVLYVDKREFRKFFAMGFICAISILFREGSIVLLTPILAVHLLKNFSFPRMSMSATGFLFGLSIFALCNYWFYGTVIFRNPGPSFGIAELGQNILLISITLLIWFPLGIVSLFYSKSNVHQELVAGLFCYTLMHIFYEYDILGSSGVKGYLLYSRFFLAVAPIFVLYYALTVKKDYLKWIFISTGVLVFTINGFSFFVEKNYKTIASNIESYTSGHKLFVNNSLSEITKLTWPINRNIKLQATYWNSIEELREDEMYLVIGQKIDALDDRIMDREALQLIYSDDFFNSKYYFLYKKVSSKKEY